MFADFGLRSTKLNLHMQSYQTGYLATRTEIREKIKPMIKTSTSLDRLPQCFRLVLEFLNLLHLSKTWSCSNLSLHLLQTIRNLANTLDL